MSSWPKDKVPKRNSGGDRWREQQLVKSAQLYNGAGE